jgi:hypothetical protein
MENTHMYGIRYAALAGYPIHSQGEPPVGAWLESFDPAAYDGRGLVRWTVDPAKAARFPSKEMAFRTWYASPACRPIRPDGKPNRPLTAYTVTIEELP